MPIWDVAQRYREAGDSVVLVAGERYGTGSSRDWAAKGQRLLGIRAVLAAELRAHPPLQPDRHGHPAAALPAGMREKLLGLAPGDRIWVDAPEERIYPRADVAAKIVRPDGTEEPFTATAAVETGLECELLAVGGVIPMILRRTLTA